ncbi:cupin domain-containing protein [Pseudoalteromonas sp. R3]|uniref:cupin domain-containing protein n=1 Tax=Pseudoalteromonas sp. R3 TaxID=1709477 RepID=UPI0009E6D2DD|nr:cupin domain-containing protein [Pseudoalteromonas sp. R3]AZZ96143.1 cupin domain-containing protein [Pseudoalteromonas sp. R3]
MSESKLVSLVKRDDIPSIRTIEVNGVEHWLGHVKDFTKHEGLTEFLPKDNRISMAWVRLEAGEQLDEHIHPVESMILICEGGASTLGDVETDMGAGDALLVPPGRPHGFIGAEPAGFWGLSLQFDSRGLYEDIADPWATFHEDENYELKHADTIVDKLFQKNEIFKDRFDKHRLFALVNKGLLTDSETRNRFLDCFQVWSNHFQKMVFNRYLTSAEGAHLDLAWDHLIEEFGHNMDLASSRDSSTRIFDPVLEATSSWFCSILNRLSDMQKLVLIHLVVEASATVFYKHVAPVMSETQHSRHFHEHDDGDHEHVKMGYDFVRRQTPSLSEAEGLLEIQEQGWSMLMSVMSRIADLVVYGSERQSNSNAEQATKQPAAELES